MVGLGVLSLGGWSMPGGCVASSRPHDSSAPAPLAFIYHSPTPSHPTPFPTPPHNTACPAPQDAALAWCAANFKEQRHPLVAAMRAQVSTMAAGQPGCG